MKRIMAKEETIKGSVVATEWDKNNNVIAIGILSEDDDYVIDDSNDVGRELFDFLDEEVKVTGIIKKGRRGSKVITIMDYEVLHQDDYGLYDDLELYSENDGDDMDE
jgi:hypothetical protein